jgi:hypothetical protein
MISYRIPPEDNGHGKSHRLRELSELESRETSRNVGEGRDGLSKDWPKVEEGRGRNDRLEKVFFAQ